MKSVLVLISLLFSCISNASPRQVNREVGSDGAQVIVIDGPISGGTMGQLIEFLETKLVAPKPGKHLIDIVINSPGGSVNAGFEFVSLMNDLQDRDWTFRCYVGTMAASMAFQIFNQCDERYSLNNSLLLWHRCRIGGGRAMTGPMLLALSEQLETIDNVIISDLYEKINANPYWIKHHLEVETFHLGSQLQKNTGDYLESHRSIPGLIEALKNKKLPRTHDEPIFFFGSIRVDEIMYIWSGYEASLSLIGG